MSNQNLDDDIRQLLHYDEVTKKIVWLQARCNRAKIGSPAGTLGSNGYVFIKVSGKRMKAHRIAWFLVYGVWPTGNLDHINNDRSDNAIENLRIAVPFENTWNSKMSARNTSGVKGVFWCKSCSRWRVHLRANGKVVKDGGFKSLEEAIVAIQALRELHHGQFANHG